MFVAIWPIFTLLLALSLINAALVQKLFANFVRLLFVAGKVGYGEFNSDVVVVFFKELPAAGNEIHEALETKTVG